MKKGKIAEFGSHSELIAKNGIYTKLCADQQQVDDQVAQNAAIQNEEQKKPDKLVQLAATVETEMDALPSTRGLLAT